MWAGVAKLDVLATTARTWGAASGWKIGNIGMVLERDLEDGVPVNDDWHHAS